MQSTNCRGGNIFFLNVLNNSIKRFDFSKICEICEISFANEKKAPFFFFFYTQGMSVLEKHSKGI